jgi:Flp pilus assembly pilin Flp
MLTGIYLGNPNSLARNQINLRRFIVSNYSRGEQGQGLLSYTMILVLVAVVVVTALASYGRRLSFTYDEISCVFSGYPEEAGPLSITAIGRTDSDSVWMEFALSAAIEVTFTDLRSGFSETFDLGPQHSTWLSEDDLGQGHAEAGSGLISARIADGSYVCGRYPAAD